jgi:uncharacterized protein
MALLITSALLSLLMLTFAVKGSFFKLPSFEKIHLPFFSFLGAYGIYYGLLLVVGAVLSVIFSSISFPIGYPKLLVMNIFFVLIGGSALTFYLFLLPSHHSALILWGGKKRSLNRVMSSFKNGVFAWGVAFPLVTLFSQALHQVRIVLGSEEKAEQVAVNLLQQAKDFPGVFWGSLFVIICIVPYVEELLYRGFLHTWLRNFLPRIVVIILNATLFAFAHFSFGQGSANFEIVGGLLIFSLFLDFLYERERTLWAPYFAHVCFNAVSGLLLVLQS